MNIKLLDKEFVICKVDDVSQVNLKDEFCFLGKTDEEISLVCSEDCIPQNITKCDRNWRGFRIQGELDFSIVGILSKISVLLSENQISIFAVSTYNTDYIFIKSNNFNPAINVMKQNGYLIVE